jgi:predicted RecB family nuclease
MRTTPDLFEAYLKCPTKCWLRSRGEAGGGNEYADWVRSQNESYRHANATRLLESFPDSERVIAPPATGNLKTVKWRLAVNVPVETAILESCLHAIERLPAEGRGKPAQFIPTRFVFTNKLTKDDRLLVAFDAFVLSEMLGREVSLGKIIHGDSHATLKVKTSAQFKEVRKRIEKIAALLASQSPPDLILNRHCAECEFQARCRQKAVEKDDLSLLAGMSEKERKKFNSKGIFTVTQLSYTFRPRRRPKRLRDKREKYHHALKALAIREKKIHIVGSPELKIEGTPVYLDVEGLPDRDFYYLIGLRIGNGEAAVQHSLWADTFEDEGKIWREFLAILQTVEKPVLIHYGSFENRFLTKMATQYGPPRGQDLEESLNPESINLLSVLLEQVYFPTHSNSLKDIGAWLGFSWSEASPIGVNAIACRSEWDRTHDPLAKARLISYNTEDCLAAEVVTRAMRRLIPRDASEGAVETSDVAVRVQSLKRPQRRWGNFVSPFKEFEAVNATAQWDYQRDRIYVKSAKAVIRASRTPDPKRSKWWDSIPAKKVISCLNSTSCPFCGGGNEVIRRYTRTLYDLSFGRTSIKRRVVKYRFQQYRCSDCQKQFGEPSEFWPDSHFGRNLVAYVVYETIGLRIPYVTVQKNLSRFFGLDLPEYTLRFIRSIAAKYYRETYASILDRLVKGSVLHVDETDVSIRGKPAYVWVFTNLHDVAYMYAASREGAFLHEMLKDFTGVLVSDFYGAYDSISCAQQKCLVHLLRIVQ